MLELPQSPKTSLGRYTKNSNPTSLVSPVSEISTSWPLKTGNSPLGTLGYPFHELQPSLFVRAAIYGDRVIFMMGLSEAFLCSRRGMMALLCKAPETGTILFLKVRVSGLG